MKNTCIAVMVSALLAGCAELNGALETANSVLGRVNEGIGNVAGTAGVSGGRKIYRVGNRETAQYKITGLTVTVFDINPKAGSTMYDKASVSIDGTLYNKTNRRIGVSYSIPIYDSSGRYVRSVVGSSYAPAKETAKIATGDLHVVDWNGGERINVQKMEITVRTF